MTYKFKRTIVGGTFDHLHAGHQKLLTTAFEHSEYVVIGLSTNALFQHKTQAEWIEEYTVRKSSLETFLHTHKFDNKFEIIPIHDFYGTTLTDKTIESIVITESNKENVEKINGERAKRGFPPLETIIIPYVLGQNGRAISSAQIRSGQIDRSGNNYLSQFLIDEQFYLPEEERSAFRVPFGSIYTDLDDMASMLQKRPMVIAVGDVIANALLQKNFQASISIVDGKTRRDEKIDTKALEQAGKLSETANQAGTINQKAVTCLQAAIDSFLKTNQKQVIHVSGEEDLLAVPAVDRKSVV